MDYILQHTQTAQEKKVIGLCCKALAEDPLMLSKFIADVALNNYKGWLIYKQILSDTKLIGDNSRHQPVHDSRPMGNSRLGTYYTRLKENITYIPQLPLQYCKTLKDKVKLIMDSDCSPDIKAELLSSLDKEMESYLA